MLDAPFGFPSSRFPANGFPATRLIDFTTRFAVRPPVNDRSCPCVNRSPLETASVFQFLTEALDNTQSGLGKIHSSA